MSKESDFRRSELASKISQQDRYGMSDTGVTNPHTDAYIKLSVNGEVEIYAGNGTGIILNPDSRSITLMGDSIKFITNDEDGMRWNGMSFNSQATEYSEPALLPFEQGTRPNVFRDLNDYFEDD